ncbi:MAG: dTMP kinase [Deltaproteobacteria bacterium]|jgi:dTMP kinase|nr:dTMP kinase [Deltaproteobacteria bacterium]
MADVPVHLDPTQTGPTQTGPAGLARFYAFEGLDGSGKSTQATLLRDALERQGLKPLQRREPTDGSEGRLIRERASSGALSIAPHLEMELYLADRLRDVNEKILPALKAGHPVIIDRYVLSNVAYQGARGAYAPLDILALNENFPRPDLTFLLDVPPELALSRVGARGGPRSGYENLAYLTKVKAIYDSLASPEPLAGGQPRPGGLPYPGLVRIDGRLAPDQVHALVLKAVRELDLSQSGYWPSLRPAGPEV